MSPEGKRLLRSFVNSTYDTMRVSVRIRNSPGVPIGKTIRQVRGLADSVLSGFAKPVLTGGLVVTAWQIEELVRSVIYATFITLGIITILMMIQMGTPVFGLISLIPNIPAIVTAFGLMGWLGIGLDLVTIFAGTVAVSLAVDNTMQFVAQLKREVRLNPSQGVRGCLFRAYGLAAKPMVTWSVVTILGFLALVIMPYRGAACFGLLVSSALVAGLFGDLVFFQSLILTSESVTKIIGRAIEKEAAMQENDFHPKARP